MPDNQSNPETRPSLILRLRNPDDLLAWQEFVEVYQPLICSLAVRRGLQKADADDVSQEVLTNVARHIDKWTSDGKATSFRRWLATITRNETFLLFRKRARQPELGLDSQIGQVANEVQEDEFELEHERQLFAWAARQVQGRFQANTWQAFWLTAVDGCKAADISTKLGMSVAQVYVARSRVMTALKGAVENSEFESQVDGRVK